MYTCMCMYVCVCVYAGVYGFMHAYMYVQFVNECKPALRIDVSRTELSYSYAYYTHMYMRACGSIYLYVFT